jgi:hypothetical protein
MKRATFVALGTGAVIGSAAAIGIGSSDAATIPELSRSAYEDGLIRIAASRGNALAQCDALDASQRDLCRVQATSDATVRTAELEERYRRDDGTARAAQRARIDARYEIARARCQPLKGFRRDKCLIQAHAARGRALLQANAPYQRANAN